MCSLFISYIVYTFLYKATYNSFKFVNLIIIMHMKFLYENVAFSLY